MQGISAAWIALPSAVAVIAIIVAVIVIAKSCKLKDKKEESEGEDKGAIKSSNAMLTP